MRRSRLAALVCWGPLIVALLAAAILWTLVDRWWPLLPLGYGPRWPWLALVPLPLLAGGSWPRRFVATTATLVVVAWALLGWRGVLPRPSGNDQAPGLRVVFFNAAGHTNALVSVLAEGNQWGADLIAVVECPRGGESRELPGFHRVRSGEVCVWSRTAAAPRIRMAPRDTRSIGWSGSIAMIDLPGTVVGNFGVMHLRSVRNELKEFLDLSELKEQSDSMEARRSKRVSGSIYASGWYRGLPVPPQIIVGDFNLVPESPRFRRDWGDWTDAWEEAGFGTGYTWYSRWFGLRIDRLIHTAEWRTRSVRIGDNVGSDHRPLFVELVRD